MVELQIARRTIIPDTEQTTSDVLATIPFRSGTYMIEGREFDLKVGKYNAKKGTQKVVLISPDLKAKQSEQRRVVKFPFDSDKTVVHELSKTEQLVFSRKVDEAEKADQDANRYSFINEYYL